VLMMRARRKGELPQAEGPASPAPETADEPSTSENRPGAAPRAS